MFDSILFFIHLVLLLFVIFLPALPLNILQYAIFVPVILAIMWVILGGCPLTRIDKNITDNSFTHMVLKKIFPTISKDTSDNTLYAIIIAGMLISGLRLSRGGIGLWKSN